MIAVGERDAGVRGAGHRRGDPGHHFVGNVLRAQELQFLAAAAEHERVAALESHHAPPGPGVFQHQRVDAVLRGVMAAGFLGHLDTLGIAAGERQCLGAHQAVVQDHVRLVHRPQRAQREQARIARTGADQHHAAAGHLVRRCQQTLGLGLRRSGPAAAHQVRH